MKKNSIGILLSTKKFGDIDIISYFLTRDFGIVSGLIKAGQTKKHKYQYQIGNIFSVEWYARLSEQLGYIKANFISSNYYSIFDDINRLELLVCICNIINTNIISDENSDIIYANTLNIIKILCTPETSYKEILMQYFLYEKDLLANLGFGFDLSRCAVTGSSNISKLKYISPATARAVSEIGGIGYEKKLFKMPEFFLTRKDSYIIERNEFKYANDVLIFFLKKNLFLNRSDKSILEHRNIIINKIIEIC